MKILSEPLTQQEEDYFESTYGSVCQEKNVRKPINKFTSTDSFYGRDGMNNCFCFSLLKQIGTEVKSKHKASWI